MLHTFHFSLTSLIDFINLPFFGALVQSYQELIILKVNFKQKEPYNKNSPGNFRIFQEPIKYLRWSLLRKQLTGFIHQLFSQKVPLKMFARDLKTPLRRSRPQMYFKKVFLKISQYSQENICVGEHDAIAICVGLSF